MQLGNLLSQCAQADPTICIPPFFAKDRMTTSFNRRQILARATATGAIGAIGTSFATSAWAQAAARSAPPKAPKLAGTLRIVIPANPGGG